MKARWFVLLLFLPLVSGCGEREDREGGAPSGGEREAPAPAPPGWKTMTWPMTRGGVELQGRVQDPVLKKPVVAGTFAMEGPGGAEAVVSGDTIYVGDVIGNCYAIDLATREERWKFVTDGSIVAAPALASGLVLVPSGDGKFYALDAGTGEERWHFEGADKFSAGGVVLTSPDGREEWVLVNCYDGTAYCLRVADGSEVWSYETTHYLNSSSALVDGKLVVFGGCDAVIHAVGFADGAPVHAIETEAQITNSGATWGSLVYCGNHGSQVLAVDVNSEEVKWTYLGEDFPFVAAPAVDQDHVYIGARDKRMHAINRGTGESAWTFRTGGRVESSPIAFADAVVFGSSDGRLYAVETKKGTELWRLDLGEGLTAPPAFAAGRLVIAGGDGTVFVIEDGE